MKIFKIFFYLKTADVFYWSFELVIFSSHLPVYDISINEFIMLCVITF